ncbi:MAG: imidazole glycerol phosphate synthase subunit HisH [Deltaproteobacteria bacterium]|nr:imidazole glycerol phosphate synthase subunit HisH [Deltaproteobacteria bacterium]MBW2052773.1 imidazole glycerol phosphate synthase subunit HisH [Deltaproteobacteria bacterium]MBW2142088.1 imidazole glycerol phosphate synthase subunit HisH [Deltaproteobacteria bacterium]MBW2324593.1 imidazole glycerol phosphate synthase subunit HisH [Deltaproteobacteria bacterium]
MIAIIDYKAGNLVSVERAVRALGFGCQITRDPGRIKTAERVIFPGVGAAGSAMADLKRTGLDKVLKSVFKKGTPLLGICLGTQIILEFSDEDGGTECLGLLPGKVERFPANMSEAGQRLKVPHMGWNRISFVRDHPVFSGLDPEYEFYFVHSYFPAPSQDRHVIALTDYGLSFASIVAQDNLAAVQFHLEKSGRPGLKILKNFCEWDGKDA